MKRPFITYLTVIVLCSFLDPTDAAALARIGSVDTSDRNTLTTKPPTPVIIAPSMLPMSQVNLLLTDTKQDQPTSDRVSVSESRRPDMPVELLSYRKDQQKPSAALAGFNVILNDPKLAETEATTTTTTTTPAPRPITNRWHVHQLSPNPAQVTPSLINPPEDGVQMFKVSSSPAPPIYNPHNQQNYLGQQNLEEIQPVHLDNPMLRSPPLQQPTENLLNWLMMAQSANEAAQPVKNIPLEDLNSKDDMLNYEDYDYIESRSGYEFSDEEEDVIDEPIIVITEAPIKDVVLHLSTAQPIVKQPTRYGVIRQTMDHNYEQEILDSEPRMTTQSLAMNREDMDMDMAQTNRQQGEARRPAPIGLQRPSQAMEKPPTQQPAKVESRRPEPIGLQRPTGSKPEPIGLQRPTGTTKQPEPVGVQRPSPAMEEQRPALTSAQQSLKDEPKRPEPIGLQRPAPKQKPEPIGLQGPSLVEARRPGKPAKQVTQKTTTTKRPVQSIKQPTQVQKPKTEFQMGNIKVNLVIPESYTSTEAPSTPIETNIQATKSAASGENPTDDGNIEDLRGHSAVALRPPPVGPSESVQIESSDVLPNQNENTKPSVRIENPFGKEKSQFAPISSYRPPNMNSADSVLYNYQHQKLARPLMEMQNYNNYRPITPGPVGPPYSGATTNYYQTFPIDINKPAGIQNPIGVSGNVIRPTSSPARPPYSDATTNYYQTFPIDINKPAGIQNPIGVSGNVIRPTSGPARPPYFMSTPGPTRPIEVLKPAGIENPIGVSGNVIKPLPYPLDLNNQGRPTNIIESQMGNVNGNLDNLGDTLVPIRPPFLSTIPAGQQTRPPGNGVNFVVTNPPVIRPPFNINNALFDLFQEQTKPISLSEFQMGNGFIQQPVTNQPASSVGNLFSAFPGPPFMLPGYYQMGGYYQYPTTMANSTTTATTISPPTGSILPCMTTTATPVNQQASNSDLIPVTAATPGSAETTTATTTTTSTTTEAFTLPSKRPSFFFNSGSSSSSSSSPSSSVSSDGSISYLGTSSSLSANSGVSVTGFLLFFFFIGLPIVFGVLSLLELPDIVMGILIAGVVPCSIFFILGITGALVAKKRSNSSLGRTNGDKKKRQWLDWRRISAEELRRLEREVLPLLESYPYRESRRDGRRRR